MLTPGTGESIKYKQQLTPSVEDDKFKYDVFISYSHKNPDQAEALLQAFKEIDENVKVFYDRSALTTGLFSVTYSGPEIFVFAYHKYLTNSSVESDQMPQNVTGNMTLSF